MTDTERFIFMAFKLAEYRESFADDVTVTISLTFETEVYKHHDESKLATFRRAIDKAMES